MSNRDNSIFGNLGPNVPLTQVCSECASPLSDSSEFCWMCGASRDRAKNPLRAPNSAAADAVHEANAQSSETAEEKPAQYWPESLDEASTRQAETSPNEAAAAPFEFPYRGISIAEERDQGYRVPVIRITVAVALVALIVVLGYWQRTNAVTFYGLVKNAVVNQFSSLWQDNASKRPTQTAQPAPQTRVRQHIRASAKRVVAAGLDSRSAVRPDLLPLGVKVAGKAAPAPRLTNTGFDHPSAVEVGIANAWISNARLSPMAVQISPRESLALLLRRVPPVYPEAALAAKVEGSVLLKVVIRKDGTVGSLKPLTGDPLLVPAAMDAVRQWVYRPYYLYGVSMDVETIVAVDFFMVSQVADAAPR